MVLVSIETDKGRVENTFNIFSIYQNDYGSPPAEYLAEGREGGRGGSQVRGGGGGNGGGGVGVSIINFVRRVSAPSCFEMAPAPTPAMGIFSCSRLQRLRTTFF